MAAASTLRVAETTVIGARDLKDVSRPRGTLRPYVVAWADPNHKCSTWADPVGRRFPSWGQTLCLVLPPGTAVEDATLHVQVLHAVPEDGSELLIGWATLRLRQLLVDNHGRSSSECSLQLTGPSGRPQGNVDVKLVVKQMHDRAPAAAYGVPPPPARRDSTSPPPPSYGLVENSGGMSMGFAGGAAAGVAGVLAVLALANGVDSLVDKITEVAKKLEELLATDDDSEAAEHEDDEDASDDDDEAIEDEDPWDEDEETEDSSEDEDDPAPEIIDLAYPDDGGDDGGGSGDDGGDGGGGSGDGGVNDDTK